jgi:hypothetical protein
MDDKTHNKCLGHLKILLSELVKWDITEANSATGIDNIKLIRKVIFIISLRSIGYR